MFIHLIKGLTVGIIQNSTQLRVDGHPSVVLSRASEQDLDEGWSITARPYRPQTSSEGLDPQFLCNTGENTCFLAGNRVLMADGSRRPIETVAVGDEVMTMQGPSRVRAVERPKLGMTRKIIELRGLGDQCLVISDEHPLWVRRTAADGAAEDSWGTYNLNHLMYEMRNSIAPRLASMPVPLHIDLPEQLAHETGWIHARPIYHHMPPSTQLYNLATIEGCAIFVEGFATFSHCLGALTPATTWRGLREDASAQNFLRQLSAEPA
ncbi:MAG: Hint domain-containing homing endonuclease [Bordetella sp.]|nr:Hint domain-containing homing endonuclease [Bordetella sp.]